MATEYKIIKIRGGLEADFYPAMLLPREMYISTDKGWMYYCYSAGNVKRFTTIEDIKNEITGATQEIIDEITEAVEQATIYANEQGDYAKEQGDYANTKGDYAYQKGQEAQAIVDSAAPIINTNLQATYADKATQTGEYLHVEVADDALVQITGLKGKSTQVVTETSPSPDEPSPILSVGDSDFDIVSCGKSLFDGELEQGDISTNAPGYNQPSDVRMRSKNYIKVSPNSLYSMDRKSLQFGLRFYDGSKSFLGTFSFVTGSNFTTPDNCEYMRFIVTTINLNMEFQIEIGTTATEFEPYKEDRITVDTTNQKFRGQPNGVSDGYGFNENGEFGYWQRARVYTVTGDETLTIHNPLTISKEVRISKSIIGMKTENIQFICNKFSYQAETWNVDDLYIAGNAGIGFVSIAFRIPVSATPSQWFGENPTTIQYELAEPIFTPLPEIYLKSYKGVTNVFTTAEVQPELTGTFKSELWANEYGKLDKDGDSRDNIATFTEATTEADIVSGESHDTLFGKILKSIKTFRAAIGTLSSLTTTIKTNLVAAINELKTGLDSTNSEVNTLNDNLAKLNFVKLASIYWQVKTDNYQEICFRVTTSASISSAFSESAGLHYSTVSFSLPPEISFINFAHQNIVVAYEGGGVYIANIVSFNPTTRVLILAVSRPTAFTNQAILFNVQMKLFK